jgi:hypothetical protein
VLAELRRKAALIAETEAAGKHAKFLLALANPFTGSTNATLHPIVARRKAERIRETALELTNRQTAGIREFLGRRVFGDILLEHARGRPNFNIQRSHGRLPHTDARDA